MAWCFLLIIAQVTPDTPWAQPDAIHFFIVICCLTEVTITVSAYISGNLFTVNPRIANEDKVTSWLPILPMVIALGGLLGVPELWGDCMSPSPEQDN